MAKPFKGTINIDIKDSTPDWEPYAQPIAPEGTPSVLYIPGECAMLLAVLGERGFNTAPDQDGRKCLAA